MIFSPKLRKIYILIWIALYILGIFLWIKNIFSWYFLIISELYLLGFFALNVQYSITSYKNPEKKEHREYFLNEIILTLAYLALIIYLPFLFPISLGATLWRFIFFNLWNSLSIHQLCWMIYIHFARRNNRKKHRKMLYSEWLELIQQIHAGKDEETHNFTRKLMHFGISAGLIIIYFSAPLFIKIPLFLKMGVSSLLFARYWWLAVCLHLLWMLNLADLFRLQSFSDLGRFATRWMESSIREKEFHTFTSAPLMIISWFPFLLVRQPIFIIVAIIGAVSDALASIIGKKFGKNRDKHGKTIIGYVTGFSATFILTFLGFILFIPSITSILWITTISITCGLAFYVIDRYTSIISDNFLIPVIIGIILWIFIEIV